MDQRELEHLGEPDLQIGELRIWIHGRQFPDCADYWDGNWLRVTACCMYPDSVVRLHGTFIHLSEVFRFMRGCERLYRDLTGHAMLDCIEANLKVELSAETGGHIKIEINITPDHLNERHIFTDGFDQTFLPAIITGCKRILSRLPVREAEKLPA